MIEITEELKNDIFGWDIENWSHALKYWENHIPDKDTLNCLELGARSGGPSLWLSLNGHMVKCSDLSKPGNDAKLLHEKYDVSDKIEYMAVDALNIPFENQFDVIIFKSIIGGVSRDGQDYNKPLVFQQIKKALKPQGVLLFAENLKGSMIHQLGRRLFRRWGASWNYMTRKELEYCLEIFEAYEIKSNGFLSAFSSRKFTSRVLIGLDKLLKPVIPFSWKYVVYGHAIKQ